MLRRQIVLPLIAVVFLFPAGPSVIGEPSGLRIPAGTATPLGAQTDSKIEPMTDTIKKTLNPVTCDEKLLRKISGHLHGVRCLSRWDHGCLGQWASILGGTTAILGPTRYFMFEARESVQKRKLLGKVARLKEANEAGLNSSEFVEKMKELDSAGDRVVIRGGKEVFQTTQQVRTEIWKSLEELASQASEAEVRGAIKLSIGIARTQAARSALVVVGAAFSAGTIAALAAVDYLSDMGSVPCESGSPYVDLKPKPGLAVSGCENTYDLNGPNLRKFFRESASRQLSILEKDHELCAYLNQIDGSLEGMIKGQLEMFSRVKFTAMPVCLSEEAKLSETVKSAQPDAKATIRTGISYSIEMEGHKFTVTAKNDPVTKAVRSVTVSEPADRTGRNRVTVDYISTADGSHVSKVSIPDFSPLRPDLEMPLERAIVVSDLRSDKHAAIMAAAASQVWTPKTASCCGEKDARDCWIGKELPGLKEIASGKDPVVNAPAVVPDSLHSGQK